jgi:uncharacterized protein (DUF1778 family)
MLHDGQQHERRERLSVSIEAGLRSAIERAAECERRSVSNFVGKVLAAALTRTEADAVSR